LQVCFSSPPSIILKLDESRMIETFVLHFDHPIYSHLIAIEWDYHHGRTDLGAGD